jgi:hypothetical protein
MQPAAMIRCTQHTIGYAVYYTRRHRGSMDRTRRSSSYIITPHALAAIERRGLGLPLVDSIVRDPDQQIELRAGRVVRQSKRVLAPGARVYLLRVVLDVDRSPAVVVTAYRTTKIAKYWRSES